MKKLYAACLLVAAVMTCALYLFGQQAGPGGTTITVANVAGATSGLSVANVGEAYTLTSTNAAGGTANATFTNGASIFYATTNGVTQTTSSNVYYYHTNFTFTGLTGFSMATNTWFQTNCGVMTYDYKTESISVNIGNLAAGAAICYQLNLGSPGGSATAHLQYGTSFETSTIGVITLTVANGIIYFGASGFTATDTYEVVLDMKVTMCGTNCVVSPTYPQID